MSQAKFRSLLEERTDMLMKSSLAYRSTAKQGHTHSRSTCPTSICYTALVVCVTTGVFSFLH